MTELQQKIMTEKLSLEVRNSTGVITLDRPKALNAIDQEMVDEIGPVLRAWESDPAVEQVLIRSTSSKAFCAGGDIRYGYSHMAAGNTEQAEHFFASSYDLHAQVAAFPKPYVATIDGIAMGGGLGISAHGSFRVVTERASASMPEIYIAFVPDVGMSYEMQRMEGTKGYASASLATFIGTTALRLSAADMLWSGVGTHFVPSAELADFEAAVITGSIEEALERFSGTLDQPSRIAGFETGIEECFSGGEWAEIADRLAASPDTELQQLVLAQQERANPASIVAAVELYRAQPSSAREALDNEAAVGKLLRQDPNFFEGIRTVLIDKGDTPRFSPARTVEVDPAPYRSALAPD